MGPALFQVVEGNTPVPQGISRLRPPATRKTAEGPEQHPVSSLRLPSFIQHVPSTWKCVGDTRHPRGPPQVPKRAAARSLGSKQTQLMENYTTGSGQARWDPRSACLWTEPRAHSMNCLKQGKAYLDQEQGPRPEHCMGQVPTGKLPGWPRMHFTGEETEFPHLIHRHRVEIQAF